ncbi:MAG: ATP-dependent DNA helicase RecG, partial [Oscillospiraceae bacterium]
MDMNTDIRFIKGVGEKRAELFGRLGVFDVNSLLHLYPRDYQSWSNPVRISQAPLGEVSCIKATIVTPVEEHYFRKNMVIYRFSCIDENGISILNVTIFNNKYLAKNLVKEKQYLFYGKVEGDLVERSMNSPLIKPISFQKIHPIYKSTAGLASFSIEKVVKDVLFSCEIPDFMPQSIINEQNLCSLSFAIHNIHFPKNDAALAISRRRLIFDELFVLQMGLIFKKNQSMQKTDFIIKSHFTDQFWALLPFEPTSAQTVAVEECLADMSSGIAMSRLIQGDVGSGKTAVAAAVIFNAIKNGMQAAFMAPTEILAEQHLKTFLKFFEGQNISVELLTGSVTKKRKTAIKSALENGEIDLIIGTHAIIQSDVHFKSLGLVITDEQHRFGVAQRTALQTKSANPHVLVMSATPIPRTMSLILYGDLSISTIDSMPLGRKVIETYTVSSSLHQRVYSFIKKHIDAGRQAYIVCPLVEDDETDL